MVSSVLERIVGKKKKSKKHDNKSNKKKLSDNDKKFLISLYPNGRSLTSLVSQLKVIHPHSNESVIKDKIRVWIESMKNMGLITVIVAEDIGTAVGLSNEGIIYVRNKIKKLMKKDLPTFVSILNKLIQHRDKWAIELYQKKVRKLIKNNIAFFTIVFDKKPIELIISQLKDPFGIDVTNPEIYRKFLNLIDKLEIFGLIEIEEINNKTYISSSVTAKEFLPLILRDVMKDRKKITEDIKKKIYMKKSLQTKSFKNNLFSKFNLNFRIFDMLVIIVIILTTILSVTITNLIETFYIRSIIPFLFISEFVIYFLITRLYMYINIIRARERIKKIKE